MRIGIFGGSFDPVHLGHLILAEQSREQGGLDQVWFTPAARPPHKPDSDLTPFAQRVEMLALALAGQPAFRIEERERDRPGPSFTADTLDELERVHPGNEWFLLIGGDTLRDLPGWYEPRRIVARAGLIVMARPGVPIVSAEEMGQRLGASVRLQAVEAPLSDIASSDLRQRLRSGRSVRYLIPRAVEAYIADKHLYGGSATSDNVRYV
jgi:nicotinate-nucleotide adenylyltransferase